jgi:protein SCO1
MSVDRRFSPPLPRAPLRSAETSLGAAGTSARATLAACALLLFAAACAPKNNLPDLGAVPDFRLTDSRGHPFLGTTLRGNVWVADFIYTNCPGPCPRMTSIMHQVERKVALDEDVRLVSFSVDPDRDTPPVLAEYAHHFGGPTPHWFFLTGDRATTHTLAHDVFKVGDLIGVMDHSTHFILVDKRSHIRGYYSTFDRDGVPKLLDDLRQLRKETV